MTFQILCMILETELLLTNTSNSYSSKATPFFSRVSVRNLYFVVEAFDVLWKQIFHRLKDGCIICLFMYFKRIKANRYSSHSKLWLCPAVGKALSCFNWISATSIKDKTHVDSFWRFLYRTTPVYFHRPVQSEVESPKFVGCLLCSSNPGNLAESGIIAKRNWL